MHDHDMHPILHTAYPEFVSNRNGVYGDMRGP